MPREPSESRRLKRWLSSGYYTWLQTIVSVLGARGFAAAAAFLCHILVANQLGVAGYGQFYFLFTVMTLTAGFIGPAVDTSLVRFAAKKITPETDDSGPYFKFVLYTKLAVLVVTILVSVPLAPGLLALFGPANTTTTPDSAIVLAFCGGNAIALWGFAQAYFQSHQRFRHYAAFELFSSSLRLILVAALMFWDRQHFMAYLIAYAAAPFTTAVLAWTRLPTSVFVTRTNWAVGRELWRFGKWVFVAAAFNNATQRLDLLLLNFAPFGIDETAIGIYSAAVSLALAGELVQLTAYSVLLPKVSQMQSPSDLRKFIGQFRLPSLILPAAIVLAMPWTPWFVRVTFGAEFADAALHLNILLLGVCATLVVAPAVLSLYSLGDARRHARYEALRFALTLGIGFFAVPAYGALGAACTMAGVRIAISVALYLVAHRAVRARSIAELEGFDG